jgi:hypothetical protein
MTDLHDIRALLRENKHQPAPERAGGSGVTFWIVAACAAAAAFAIVLFTPRFFAAQRTAALPVAQSVPSRAVAGPPANVVAIPSVPPPGNAARYAGKSAEDMAKLADATCTQHAHPSRLLSQTDPETLARRPQAPAESLIDDNERLRCLMSEAPARYCVPSQRSKITADIINYFKAIEYRNVAITLAAKVATFGPDTRRMANAGGTAVGQIEVDPRVIEGVEGLMRAGYLQRPQREDIGANVPRPVKDRFARVIGLASPCPTPPWWAVWK